MKKLRRRLALWQRRLRRWQRAHKPDFRFLLTWLG